MRTDAITLKQLRALAAICRHRSMTAAAGALSLTTPAVHSQIRALEGIAGTALVARADDGYAPTPAGEAFLRASARIEAALGQAAHQVGALSHGATGHVVLGTVSTAKYFAPRLVRMLRDACPDIEVTLRVANRAETLDALGREAYDLAIMGRPSREVMDHAAPLGPHPHGIVLPPDHPLAGVDGYDADALFSETFLSREDGSGTRILMERWIDRTGEGRRPRTAVMPSNETIKQAVLAGLGVGFLSLHTVQDELASGRLSLLRGPHLPVMRHWYLVVPQGASGPTIAARRIASEIGTLAGRYLPGPIG